MVNHTYDGNDALSELEGFPKKLEKLAMIIKPPLPQAGEPVAFVPAQLRKAAEIYEGRNPLYGDNYKRFGGIMLALFGGQMPDISTPEAMNRFGIFVQLVAKLTRYAENFNRGGHDDSLDDTSVYAMMLKELDAEARAKKGK